jgi:phage repressor protein C with HTH and peptisase S24 domain
MTTKKNTATTGARLGRVRMSDDSMKGSGIRKGDLALVKLGARPRQDKPVAAFTATGELVVRNYHRERNGDIRLTRDPLGKVIQVFKPRAVVLFGPVVRVEKGDA